MPENDALKISTEKISKSPDQIAAIHGVIENFEHIQNTLKDFCDTKDEVVGLSFDTIGLSRAAVLSCLEHRFINPKLNN